MAACWWCISNVWGGGLGPRLSDSFFYAPRNGDTCRALPDAAAIEAHGGPLRRIEHVSGLETDRRLLASWWRGSEQIKPGFPGRQGYASPPPLFHQTNIFAVVIPHYRSFDAVDLAVTRTCIGT